MFREFAGLDTGEDRLPDESTILRFRHLIEAHNLNLQILATVNATLAAKGLLLKSGTVVDVKLIAAQSSNKNSSGERVPEMRLVNDATHAHALVHGEEIHVLADAGYQGVNKRAETQDIDISWHVAMRPGKRKTLNKRTSLGAILDQLEQAKARIRAKVEHPFRVIKRQFGYVKVKYRGRAKNTVNLMTLFALSNLWMTRQRVLQVLQG
jgi:IS5 family transposase